jgi:hypothetical protein
MWRPKQNTYYDIASAIAIAREKKAEFNEAVEQMAQADNDMDQRDVSWNYGEGRGAGGANWAQSHE